MQLYLLKFQKEKAEVEGEEGLGVCTNYRFARRRAGAPAGRKKEEKAPEPDATESKKKVKKAAAPAKGKKGAKGAAAKEDDAAANELNEAEKKQKEDQEKKRLEDEARALQKPKEYAPDEVATFEQYCVELEQFFAELTIRQMGGGAAEGDEEQAEGEEPKPDGDGAEAQAEPKEEQPAQAEGEAQEAGDQEPEAPQARKGKRLLTPAFIEYDFKYLCESARATVPEPVWPDPDKEPLPPPVVHQIVRRPPARPERKEITMFSIWTPLPEQPRPASAEEGQAPAEDQEEE